MALAFVQSKSNKTAFPGNTAPTVTLTAAPTQGNLLVCAIGVAEGGVAVTISLSGWTELPTDSPTENGTSFRIGYFYKTAGASESATVTGSIGSQKGWTISVMEFSGVSSWLVDKSAHNTGTSATQDSGTTATTAAADEVCVAAIGSDRGTATALSAPTNGFTLQEQQAGGSGSSNAQLGQLYKIVSATGTQNTACTGPNRPFCGIIATFKASTVTTSQALTATGTPTATIRKQASKTVVATAPIVLATITKQAVKALAATAVSPAATIVKRVNKTLVAIAAALTATMVAVKAKGVTLTATAVSTTATIVRQTGKTLAATPALATSMRRVAGKKLTATAATLTATVSAIKALAVTITATVTTTVTIRGMAVKLLAPTVSTTATILWNLGFGKQLAVTATTAASIARSTSKTLAGTVSSAATIAAIKVRLFVMAATVATTATIRRTIAKKLSEVVSLIPTLRRTGSGVPSEILTPTDPGTDILVTPDPVDALTLLTPAAVAGSPLLTPTPPADDSMLTPT